MVVNAPTDEMLLRNYVTGEQAGLELLVRRHSAELYRFMFRLTHSSTTAEDMVQDAFLQVSISAQRFDPTRRFKPWLFTIAANKARDWLRRRNRKREVPLHVNVDRDDEYRQPRFANVLAIEVDHPHLEIDASERRRTVRAIVEQMPRIWYEVLVLAYYHRFPYRQIAEIVGIPIGTVKSRLHSAVAYFAAQYRAAASEAVARSDGESVPAPTTRGPSIRSTRCEDDLDP